MGSRTKKALSRIAAGELKQIHPSSWNRPRLKALLKALNGKSILVVGDVGVDRYTIGTVERISPEAPVPIVLVQEEKFKLGLAANVADNIQALGGVPLLTGIVGDDRTAEDFRGLLRDSGIEDKHLIADGSRRTVLKERIVSEKQQLLRVDYENQQRISAKVEALILKKVKELISRADAVIVEDYAKGLLNQDITGAIFRAAKGAKKIVAVDPNLKTPVGIYRGATLLTPNTKEAETLSGIAIQDGDSLLRAGQALLRATDARHVVITRGKEGMAIFSAGERGVRLIDTYVREVYDVSGAGDTVISVLTLALAAGASIEDAAVLGNLAAGVEVGKRGTATVTQEEIIVAMEFFGARGV